MPYHITISGAGIVGLSTAYQLLQQKPDLEIAIIEKEADVAQHQTGRNSGVIHSGIYYKPGSLRAENCIRGYRYLLDFCYKHEVDYEICGKVIVATEKSEVPVLDEILKKGKANGLEGIQKIDRAEILEKEPHCAGIVGIWVPQAGIADYKGMAQKLKSLLQEAGVAFYFGEKVLSVEKQSGAKVLTDKQKLESDLFINCSGLYSDKVAKSSGADVPVQILPFRGEYFKIKKERQHLVNNLIYPVPDPDFPFLGVHFTRMIEGGIEAGPSAVLAFQREGYHRSDVDAKELMEILKYPGFQKLAFKYWKKGLGELYRSYSKAAFTRKLQKLIPDIRQEDLEPVPAGVRAMACSPNGELLDDYLFLEDEFVLNVCNAPSPAATSGLAIGESVAVKALKSF
ncbi:MAG: L-2-hydroxyglutarate oxidase [Chitinophagales bacterium]